MSLAIIDGDVLVYQACKSRFSSFSVINLDDDGDKIMPQFTKEQDAKYLKQCWDNFNQDLVNLTEKLYCTDYLMAVKGDGCFRHDIYDDYKKNRKTQDPKRVQMVNEFVPILRKLAVKSGLAVPADGREADDLIRTWAEEARRVNQKYVICSIDKDLRCIPGTHYIMHYETEKQVILDISEDAAKRHYYEQLLKGDPTDNIPGVPRVGEVKAKKLISECSTEKEMQERVVEAYLVAYGDEWYDYFLINAKLIHLQTHFNDYFDCRHWPIIQELC